MREQLSALYLRREQILQRMTDAPEAEFAVLTEAAVRISEKCRRTEEMIAARSHPQQMRLPEWSACDMDARRTVARTLLHGVFSDGEMLHVFLQ